MEWIANNWYLLVAFAAAAAMVAAYVVTFFKQPTGTQIDNLKEWLKYAVVEAEKALGEKTGQLKLRMVYDMAIQKFPWISVVSFDMFSSWVDEALVWLETQLSSNIGTIKYISGE